jgi:hypothetical protein
MGNERDYFLFLFVWVAIYININALTIEEAAELPPFLPLFVM